MKLFRADVLRYRPEGSFDIVFQSEGDLFEAIQTLARPIKP